MVCESCLLIFTVSTYVFFLRWAGRYAPELLTSESFSQKSDVWAYGVTLWEIFTLGATPYNGESTVAIKAALRKDQWLSPPDNLPLALWDIITSCWTPAIGKRPVCYVNCLLLNTIVNEKVDRLLLNIMYFFFCFCGCACRHLLLLRAS